MPGATPEKVKHQLKGLQSNGSKAGTKIRFETYEDVKFMKEGCKNWKNQYVTDSA